MEQTPSFNAQEVVPTYMLQNVLCQGCLVSSNLMFERHSRDCQRQLLGSPKETLLYIVLFAVFFKYVLLFRCVLMLLKTVCYLCHVCLSIHLSGCPHIWALLPIHGVVGNLILETFIRVHWEIQIWLKLDINVRHVMWRPEHVCIVDSGVKYFVAQQQCGETLLHFHGNSQQLNIVDTQMWLSIKRECTVVFLWQQFQYFYFVDSDMLNNTQCINAFPW